MRDLPEPLEQFDATHVRRRGRKLIFFGGCDYFRLGRHPALLHAAAQGLRRYGLNVAASRKTTGNHPLYGQLEQVLARFFGAESATLASTGYVTNLVVAQAMVGEFSHVLLDELAHPALADAAGMFGARVLRFPHTRVESVRRMAARLGRNARSILLTDGMFARDGSVAPLRAYQRALPRTAWLLVDDAHGAGVVGVTGRGSLEHEGVDRRRIIQSVTLSKAFGAYGGAVLGSRMVRQRILERSAMFVGGTPVPLPAAAAALAGLKLLAADRARRARLRRNIAFLRELLVAGGVNAPDTPGPIVMLAPASQGQVSRLCDELLARHILPPFLRYPGGPPQGWFRFVISSEHTRGQLRVLAEAVRAAGK